MAHHATPHLTDADRTVLGNRAAPAFFTLLIVGAVCLALALVLALFFPGGAQRFGYAYLTGYAFVMALTLGALFIVIITHLFRAGWCVMVRRVPEAIAANFPLLIVLFIPIAGYVYAWNGALYPWAQDFDHHASGGGGHAITTPIEHQLISAEESPVTPASAGVSEPTGHVESTPSPEERAAGVMEHHADPHAADVHDAGPPKLEHFSNDVYTWYPHALEYFVKIKQPFFNPVFWTVRWVVYFGVFSLIGIYYWRKSVRQDGNADPALTNQREKWAPLSVIAFALALTFMVVDLLMALDPVFFSTMFAIVFFANAFTIGLCITILAYTFLQKKGFVPAVQTDHYHDLAKLLFAMVFFWGYVSYSQFMLIWYASLPETTYWFSVRGVTTHFDTPIDMAGGPGGAAPTYGSGWQIVALILLFCHLFIPFAFLLSRHVKRHRKARTFICVWMLVVCYIDFYWLVMPVLDSPNLVLTPIEPLAWIGLTAIVLAGALRVFAKASMTPVNDPRIAESLKLDTNVWAPVHH